MERRTDLWVTPEDIIDAYPDAQITDGFVAHLQGLAETCTGTVEEPTVRLKAVFVEIVYRRSLNTDAQNLQAVTLGSFTEAYNTSNAGQGLTDRECKRLKAAVGLGGLSVIKTTRGPVEMASPIRTWNEP